MGFWCAKSSILNILIVVFRNTFEFLSRSCWIFWFTEWGSIISLLFFHPGLSSTQNPKPTIYRGEKKKVITAVPHVHWLQKILCSVITARILNIVQSAKISEGTFQGSCSCMPPNWRCWSTHDPNIIWNRTCGNFNCFLKLPSPLSC